MTLGYMPARILPSHSQEPAEGTETHLVSSMRVGHVRLLTAKNPQRVLKHDLQRAGRCGADPSHSQEPAEGTETRE